MTNPSSTAPRRVTREVSYASRNGYAMAAIGLALIAFGVVMLSRRAAPAVLGIAALLAGLAVLVGLYMLQPNEGVILTLFGKYQGTDRTEGLRWRNPLQSGRKISLRARNLNTNPLKVNDKRGNPIEIAAAQAANVVAGIGQRDVKARGRAEGGWRDAKKRPAFRPFPVRWPRSSSAG